MVNSMAHRRLSIYITPSNPQHTDWLPLPHLTNKENRWRGWLACLLRVSTQTHLPFPGVAFQDTSQGLRATPAFPLQFFIARHPAMSMVINLPCQLLWLELTKARTSKIGAKRVCSHCFYALVQTQTHEVYDQGTQGSCSC